MQTLSGGAEVWGLARGPPLGGPLHPHMWWPAWTLRLGERICFMEWGDERLYSGVWPIEVMGSPCPQGTGRGCGGDAVQLLRPLFGEPGPERTQRSCAVVLTGAAEGKPSAVRVLFKKR